MRTNNGEKPEVEFASEDTRWQFAQEALEKASDGMRIPIFIRSKKINIALFGLVSYEIGGQVTKHIPMLNLSLRPLMTAELPLKR